MGFVGYCSDLLLNVDVGTFCLLITSVTNTVHEMRDSHEMDICRSIARVMFKGVYTVL